MTRPGCPGSCCPASRTATATRSTARCAAARTTVAARSGPGANGCTPSPHGSIPTRYLALARATYAEMALAGVTAVGEFHYLHHGRGRAPLRRPERDGAALAEAAADAGIRLTLLDTCYLAGGLSGEATARRRPSAVLRRRRRGAGPPGSTRCATPTGCGSVRRSTPSGPCRATELATVASAAAGRPLHVHLSEQPAENEACLARYGCTPTAAARRRGRAGRDDDGGARHPPDPHRHRDARFGTRDSVPLPYDRTRSRRRHRPGARARDAGAPLSLGTDQHAVIDMFEEARALEMDERLASLRRGNFAPGELLDATDRARLASAGRMPAGSRSGRAPISSRSGSTPSAPRGSIRRRSSSPPVPPTSTPWSSTGARSSRTASTGSGDVGANSSHQPYGRCSAGFSTPLSRAWCGDDACATHGGTAARAIRAPRPSERKYT